MFFFLNQTSNDQNSEKHFHPLKLSRLLQEGKMGGGGRRNVEAPREVILSETVNLQICWGLNSHDFPMVEMVINLGYGIFSSHLFQDSPVIAGGKTSHPQYSQQLIDPWHDP